MYDKCMMVSGDFNENDDQIGKFMKFRDALRSDKP